MEEKKPSYRKPSHRELGLRMDAELEEALVRSAKKYERTLSAEARYGLRIYLGLTPQPAEDDTGVSA